MTAQLPQDATNASLPVRDSLRDAQNAAETLPALNWSPLCGCVRHGGCTRVATHIVRVHAIGSCGQDGRDADGNRVLLRCAVCISTMRAEIARSLEELNRRFIPQCESCGAPMVRVSDVVREVEVL
jgi:hypothetical protein